MSHVEAFVSKQLGGTRESIADESRRAALEFMTGVAEGWSKVDVVIWLLGPYSFAARHVPRSGRASSRFHRVAQSSLEDLLVSTRTQLLASLEDAVLAGGTPESIEHALIEGHVRRVSDTTGATAWVPVDVARMRLRDRVASLFVADYLNRPNDYRHLYVCHLCEAITFDEQTQTHAKELGRCSAHRTSIIQVRGRLMNAV